MAEERRVISYRDLSSSQRDLMNAASGLQDALRREWGFLMETDGLFILPLGVNAADRVAKWRVALPKAHVFVDRSRLCESLLPNGRVDAVTELVNPGIELGGRGATRQMSTVFDFHEVNRRIEENNLDLSIMVITGNLSTIGWEPGRLMQMTDRLPVDYVVLDLTAGNLNNPGIKFQASNSDLAIVDAMIMTSYGRWSLFWLNGPASSLGVLMRCGEAGGDIKTGGD